MSWKAIVTLDPDHDSGNVTANFYDDKDISFTTVLFTYSRRVSLYDLQGDLKKFITDAKAAKIKSDNLATKASNYSSTVEAQLNG